MDTPAPVPVPDAGQLSDGAPPISGAPAQPPPADGKTYTKDEMETIIRARLDRQTAAHNAQIAAHNAQIATAKQQAEAAALAEQGKYKELYEQAQTAKTQAETLAAAAELRALRLQVAMSAGLPPSFAPRLQGATQEELEADAIVVKAEMQALIPPTPEPSTTAAIPPPNAALTNPARVLTTPPTPFDPNNRPRLGDGSSGLRRSSA